MPTLTVGTHYRPRRIGGRYQRLTIRLTADEFDLLAAAAGPAGLTPTGFAAHAALTVAAEHIPDNGTATASHRDDLAALQHNLITARTAVHTLAHQLHLAGSRETMIDVLAKCARAVSHLDDTCTDIHRRLRGHRA